MGSYELRDVDHIGVGQLYEGKLVLDKTWGHGYYGCTVCCGVTGTQLNPNPFGGPINTGGYTNVQGKDDCSGSWVDFTEDAYDWSSSNAAVATLPSSYASFVGVGSATGATYVQLQEAILHLNCPLKPFNPQNTLNSLKVQITTADITQDKVTVVLSAPQGVTGNLSVTLSGPSSVSLASASGVGPGTYTYSFGRTSLATGEYTSVSASWTAGNGASAKAAVSFNVLGLTRFSTYNTPYENQCSGGGGVAYVFVNNPSTCTYSTTSLNSAFMSQVGINGTGSSVASGTVKVFNATKVGQSCELPPGGIGSGSTANTFVAVSSITGSCNVTLSAGNLATNPNPNPANASWNCSDQVLLVDGTDQNNATGGVADYCPGCNTGFSGTNGHIDHYSSSQACNAHSLIDYGKYYAIRLR